MKNYSTDPQDIINSAKNLALFAGAPTMGANLVAKTATNGFTQTGNSSVAPNNPSALEQELAKVTNQYLLESRRVLSNLLTSVHGIQGGISNSWAASMSNNATTQLANIEHVAHNELETVTNIQPQNISDLPADDLGKAISERFWALKRYYESIKAQINASDLTESVKTNAINLAAKVTRDKIKSPLQQRSTSINQYSTAITILSDLGK